MDAAPFVLNTTCWLSLNGWFSIKIPFVGTDLVIVESPKEKVIEFVIPVVVPTPTDSLGLK